MHSKVLRNLVLLYVAIRALYCSLFFNDVQTAPHIVLTKVLHCINHFHIKCTISG